MSVDFYPYIVTATQIFRLSPMLFKSLQYNQVLIVHKLFSCGDNNSMCRLITYHSYTNYTSFQPSLSEIMQMRIEANKLLLKNPADLAAKKILHEAQILVSYCFTSFVSIIYKFEIPKSVLI